MGSQMAADASLDGVGTAIPHAFQAVPGRDIVMRYIQSSYQDDPIRSLLELILFIYAVRTILQSRTRGANSNFVKLSDQVRGNDARWG